MASKHSIAVSVRTRDAVEPRVAIAGVDVATIRRGGHVVVRSKKPRAVELPGPTPRGLLPAAYIGPREKYVLVQEKDKRFRIVRTGKLARVDELRNQDAELDDDNRSRISNTSDWPNCVHGHMIMTYPDGKQYIGSGTMVNRHHVITAGHCVFSSANGGWATSIQFNAGQNDSTLPFGSAWAIRLVTFTGWTDSANRDWDTGMLILDRELGDNTGWMGLISTGDGNLKDHSITVAGYPGDKGGKQLWGATAPIVGVKAQTITYDAYTKGGQSGSGAYGTWTGVQYEHVCADHVAGKNGIPNTGCRISGDKFPRLVEWMSTW